MNEHLPTFNISSLKLWDYRSFPYFEVEFDEKLTVLAGSNGAGKTSVLDATAVALGPYVGAFDEGGGILHFCPTDIRMRRVRSTSSNEMEYAPNGVRLEARGTIPGAGPDRPWSRGLAGPVKSKTTIKDAKNLIAYGKRLQEAVRTGSDVVLPLVAYYGSGRLWHMKKLMDGKLKQVSRTAGYSECLDPASSYKLFVQYFHYWSLNVLQATADPSVGGAEEFRGYLAAVRGAIDVCLAPVGWKGLRYDFGRETVVARHESYGELPVDLLSDGIRSMIAMVADIAFRAAKLNSPLGGDAARLTPGIVLIDEVDLHLHPEWQQVVLTCLLEAFPKVQFIVTTHSPQVLSTVHRKNVRLIEVEADGSAKALQPLASPYGEPSGDVLHMVMKVDPQPPVKEKGDLMRLTELVDQGDVSSQEAVDLLTGLRHTLPNHPQLQKIERSIQRQEILSGRGPARG